MRALFLATVLVLAAGCSSGVTVLEAPEPPPSTEPAFEPLTEEEMGEPADTDFEVPVVYDTLDNGLKVVLSVDRSAPTAIVAVYYNIGFRIEPRDRTGFAHLFEHMMFQGSEHLGKNEFIGLVQRNGGVLNGSTRFDFTNYFVIVPSNTVETMLWAEADRMRGLDVTQENLTNQQGVVSNEVRVNVINQPYGGFPWLDLPQTANENWYNAHNFYGELSDLEAATLDDVQQFFDTYYAPNNAVVVVVGDIDVGQTEAWVERYFGGIPRADVPPIPDISEPPQEAEKRATKVDSLAQRPALAFGYHMPPRNSEAYYAMGLLNEILLGGEDSRLHQALVSEAGVTASVDGGINWPLGNLFNYNGPTLWSAWLVHDASTPADSVLALIDRELDRVAREGVTPEELARAKVELRSEFYDTLGGTFGLGRADLLASFALFDDDPDRINTVLDRFEAVTPGLIRRTAQRVLRDENRTVIELDAAGAGT
ncbi:pitrilysin family protein [Rubrivirga sp. S365]|uniref:Pitrilysin family protein n=1 Tax=Rubrivirga litoralis TaxID=3075598 RepID=A0ABU3BS40_9BACT|nr:MULTISPECIES: pitrilysin family protein [unclassified Rubrivirga]MDT0632016.1 pitrilysin family protein [Rubrivirga sp. F394]MDT7855291.1 pitrilysin family protein [Rubrivirga sp. S365]